MSQDLRALLSVLLSLVVLIVGCGCGGISLGGETVQLTHKPTARPTSTPTIQPTSTPAPTLTPTPIGWPATVEAVLFGDEPCAPPCWQGITPGVSTEEDVVRILGQLKAERKIGVYYRSESGSSYEVGLPIGDMSIKLEDGRVKYIKSFYPYAVFRVKQVIERFGEPEAVVPYHGMPGSDSWSCEDWDDYIATVVVPTTSWLLYPSRGITYVVEAPVDGFICPQMFTVVFYYYQPRSLAEALDEDRSPVFGLNTTSQEDLVEWHGYGPGY